MKDWLGRYVPGARRSDRDDETTASPPLAGIARIVRLAHRSPFRSPGGIAVTALAGRARVRLPDVAAFALVALAAALSAAFYGDLPAEMVVGWHVGLDGAVATTHGPRLLGAALLPAIAAGLFALLRALPRVGDLEREIESARSLYDALVLLVLATLVGVHTFVVFANLG